MKGRGQAPSKTAWVSCPGSITAPTARTPRGPRTPLGPRLIARESHGRSRWPLVAGSLPAGPALPFDTPGDQSGVASLVVVVIAPLAAPGTVHFRRRTSHLADWMTDHGGFARGPDSRLQPLDLPASRSRGLHRASDRPNRWGALPSGLPHLWPWQPHRDRHRRLR